MRKRSALYGYQRQGIELLKNSNPGAALFLDMGMGKTIIVLTAVVDLLNELEVGRVLIVGPLRVIRNVWDREAVKWEHTKDLVFSKVIGTAAERQQALKTPADIYMTNYENYKKLIEQAIGLPGRRKRRNGKMVLFPFDLIVFDELTKMKSVSAKRYYAHKRIVRDKGSRRWGLTGTPAARHLVDVFGQYYVLDGGKRLGTSRDAFRKEFFNQHDYNQYLWTPKKNASKKITKLVKDMTLRLDAEDYIDIPDILLNDIELELPEHLQAQYKKFQAEMFMQLDLGIVESTTAAVLSMKCHQFANGAIYLDGTKKEWQELHQLKLEAFDDILEEANGKPVLGVFTFKHDCARLQARYKCPKLGSGTTERQEKKLIDAWIAGDIPLLIGHPDSMGYGLDGLQESGHILGFYGLDWNYEAYSQVIARLRRNGQPHPTVIVNRLIMKHTTDEIIREGLTYKAEKQKDWFRLIKKYQQKLDMAA